MRRLIITTTTLTTLLATLLLAASASPSTTSTPQAVGGILTTQPSAAEDEDPRTTVATDDDVGRDDLPGTGADMPSFDGSGPGTGRDPVSGGGSTAGGEGGDGQGSGKAPPALPAPGEAFEEEGDPEVGELEPVHPVDPALSPEGIGMKSPWSGEVNDDVHGPQDLKDGRGCSYNCITKGVAIGRGTGAELVVETDTPARLWITVWREGSYHQMRYAGDELRTSYSSLFDDLEPGTTYQAAAFAQDAEGFQSEAYGTFTTRRRHVQVEFGATVVTGTPWGAASYSVYPRVDHEWLPQFAATGLTEPFHHPMGGTQVVTIHDVGPHLDIATKVVASKKAGKNDICEGWHLPSDTVPANTTNCLAWGMAPDGITAGVELDGAKEGGAYPVPRTFWRLLAGDNGEGLHFTTSVTVKVWYA